MCEAVNPESLPVDRKSENSGHDVLFAEHVRVATA